MDAEILPAAVEAITEFFVENNYNAYSINKITDCPLPLGASVLDQRG